MDPTSLGTIACREALSLAEDLLGMRYLPTASDCKEVVKHIAHQGNQGDAAAWKRRA